MPHQLSAPATAVVGLLGSDVCPPNENAHQLRAIWLAPAQTYASLATLPEGAARAAPRAPPACRLHARVRRRGSRLDGANGGPDLGRQLWRHLRYLMCRAGVS